MVFNSKAFEEAIFKFLGLEVGDEIEVLRDRLDHNRLMIVRHPKTNSDPARK
jgi:hypothetical protein